MRRFLAVACVMTGCVGSGKDAVVPVDRGPVIITPEYETDPPEEPEDTAPDQILFETGLEQDTGDTDITGGIQTIKVELTADDEWFLWIDGEPMTAPNQQSWRTTDEVVRDMPGVDHVVAVKAVDSARVIAGFIGAVWVSQELISVTGDGYWRMTDVEPPLGWQELNFDDSSWGPALACSQQDIQTWGGYPTSLVDLDATWIWARPCRTLGEAWFRRVIRPGLP